MGLYDLGLLCVLLLLLLLLTASAATLQTGIVLNSRTTLRHQISSASKLGNEAAFEHVTLDSTVLLQLYIISIFTENQKTSRSVQEARLLPCAGVLDSGKWGKKGLSHGLHAQLLLEVTRELETLDTDSSGRCISLVQVELNTVLSGISLMLKPRPRP